MHRVGCPATAGGCFLAVCGGSQFCEHGASADLAPGEGEDLGCRGPLPGPGPGRVTGCGIGTTPLSPGRLGWEAHRASPVARGLQGTVPRHFDLGEDTWKCFSPDWFSRPDFPVLGQDSVSPTQLGRQDRLCSSNAWLKAVSPQPLPVQSVCPTVLFMPRLHVHVQGCRCLHLAQLCTSFST